MRANDELPQLIAVLAGLLLGYVEAPAWTALIAGAVAGSEGFFTPTQATRDAVATLFYRLGFVLFAYAFGLGMRLVSSWLE